MPSPSHNLEIEDEAWDELVGLHEFARLIGDEAAARFDAACAEMRYDLTHRPQRVCAPRHDPQLGVYYEKYYDDCFYVTYTVSDKPVAVVKILGIEPDFMFPG